MTQELIREHAESAWPGLAEVPTGVRARLLAPGARLLFERVTRRLGITVGPGAGADIVLHRPEEFHARLGADALIGFGESYLTGAWDAEDLAGVLTAMCRRIDTLVPAWLQRLRAAYVARPPRTEQNTEANTRGNIAHHYDLSNDLFRTFLDPTLSYSSALFDAPLTDRGDHLVAGPPRPGLPLEEAQVRKVERILDEANVGPGTRLLEIGTGWGDLAIRAAARGATVRSVTLSGEQLELARSRVEAAGFADRVSIDLLDYREVPTASTGYDAVVSVEMIEAVGHQYWSTYFRKVDELLAPGGTAVVQAITMPHQRMLATRGTWTWINKYVFPGGFLPSVETIEQTTRAHTSLRVARRLSFGAHYAETLSRWDATFRAAADDVLALGFDETFLRMWHFYLEYSRAGFVAGYLDVNQVTLTRDES